jgi:hypothetical protein
MRKVGQSGNESDPEPARVVCSVVVSTRPCQYSEVVVVVITPL